MVEGDLPAPIDLSGRHAVLMEAATDAIVVIDAENTIIDANQAAAEMFGFEPQGLIGVSLLELQAPALRARHAAAVDRYLATGERRVSWRGATVTARHRTGREFPVEISFGEFMEQGKRRFLGVIHDSSERTRLESQLRQAQKMEALGLLAGGIAHDFNNLLAAIIGYTELAEAGLEPEHRVRADVAQIRAAADRARAMTRRLLAFSRREVIQPVVLDPGVAIRALAPLLEVLVGPPVRLVLDAPIGAGAIRMDPTHFDQILINIAANARDAMPDGGTLIVRVESGPGTTVAEAPSISASGGHGWLVLTMTDTGTGMTPETREHIFDPFFTTKDPDRGTGLGLATVHGVVHQAGGTITVDSSCGTGSSFRILLPLCELASSSGRPTIASTYRLPGSPVVMLALQDAAVQTLAARILERAGGSVIVAADGRIAIDLAGATTRIDVLIVDSVPRDAISPSTAQAISVLHPLARIVYVTDPSLGQAGEVRPADPTGVGLTIPFTADHLVARVRERSMHAAIGTKIGRASPTDEAVRPDATPKRTARVRSTAGTGSSRRGRRRPG